MTLRRIGRDQMNQRVNRLVKAAAAAAIATTAAATMAGTAHATTYAGSTTAYSGTNSGTMSDGSNFNLYFTQTGVQGEVSFGLGQNATHSVGEFARTWTEVGVSNDLRMASVSYYNTDFHWSGAYLEGPPPLSSQTVLPAASGTRSVSWIQEDGTNNCDARMSYSVTT